MESSLKKSIKWILDNLSSEGNFELFSIDGNKIPDAIAIDMDMDGTYEIVCYDFNGDGEIDRVEYYSKNSNRVRIK